MCVYSHRRIGIFIFQNTQRLKYYCYIPDFSFQIFFHWWKWYMLCYWVYNSMIFAKLDLNFLFDFKYNQKLNLHILGKQFDVRSMIYVKLMNIEKS